MLDFKGQNNGFFESPCTTSYRSLETIALNGFVYCDKYGLNAAVSGASFKIHYFKSYNLPNKKN